MSKLPPATLRTLRALWDQNDMRVRENDFRKLTGVKSRAYYPFSRRLQADNLTVVDFTLSGGTTIALTFKGMLALREHYTKLYNDRPCEAHRLEMEKFSRVPDRTGAAA